VQAIDALVPAMLKLTDYVMRLAPVGVFGAIASAVTLHGLDVLTTYGKLIWQLLSGTRALVGILIGAGYAFLGNPVWSAAESGARAGHAGVFDC